MFIVLLVLLTFSTCLYAENISKVDPMIGTDGIGHTTPAATVPFGMIQVGPTNDFKGWNWCSGYHYSDKDIKGFAHNFISGAGLVSLGDILLMPTTPDKETQDIEDSHSVFSHSNEVAKPGYYSVMLDTHNVFVELTASQRMGVHRYTFKENGLGKIIIDPTHCLAEPLDTAYTNVSFVDNTTIRAQKTTKGGAGGHRTAYAYIKFSKPFDTYKEGLKGFVLYRNLTKNEVIEVNVSLSFVDSKGAELNFNSEKCSIKFEDVYKRAQSTWNEVLNRIEIESKDEKVLRGFYTSMYHAFFSPNLISDADGRYMVEKKIYKSDIPQYSNYSCWDTFRALHPLFTLLEHAKTAEFVNSMASRYTQCGLNLPLWECVGHDNFCMIGQSMAPIMSEAILKDIPGINIENAYKAMRFSISETSKNSGPYGPNGMSDYVIYDYVTNQVPCSVSKTMEYNYFDWCMSQVAKRLGRNQDYLYLLKRSMGHTNLYDRESGFFLPMKENGELVKKDSLRNWEWLKKNYVSGNIWGYSTFAPHNVEGLIRLHGGKKQFVKWLDDVFADTEPFGGTQHVDISGFSGKYAHGDEPSHHFIYLYSLAGAPEKARLHLRDVMKTHYSDTPAGLVNNDDLGQMSAWYMFTTMGFYPVNPCDCKYVIGRPFADKITIHLPNGKDFTIRAKNMSDNDSNVKVYLNNQLYEKPYLEHSTIMAGGELLFDFK